MNLKFGRSWNKEMITGQDNFFFLPNLDHIMKSLKESKYHGKTVYTRYRSRNYKLESYCI